LNRFSRGADGLCIGQLTLWVALENQEVAIELVLLILLTAGAYVGWNIGANDTANCIGTTVGAGLLPFRRAVLLVAVFAILGAVLQGRHVMETIGKQITPLDVRGAFVAQTASAVGMHLFAVWGIPVSSSSAIVGAVVGVGLVKGARTISKKTLITILVGWVLTPCLAAFSAFMVYRLLSSVFA
jgi:inorganic phosphate transporter, PiT family